MSSGEPRPEAFLSADQEIGRLWNVLPDEVIDSRAEWPIWATFAMLRMAGVRRQDVPPVNNPWPFLEPAIRAGVNAVKTRVGRKAALSIWRRALKREMPRVPSAAHHPAIPDRLVRVSLTEAEWIDMLKRETVTYPETFRFNIENRQWDLMDKNLSQLEESIAQVRRILRAKPVTDKTQPDSRHDHLS